MATINATISINSDIMSYPVRINKTMTMKKAGSCHGLEETTGLGYKKYTATTQVTLLDVSAETAAVNKASKVYIRNTGSDKSQYFIITLADTTDAVEEVGRLYAGDWLLMPWEAASADHDIMVQPSTAEPMTLEYIAFIDPS